MYDTTIQHVPKGPCWSTLRKIDTCMKRGSGSEIVLGGEIRGWALSDGEAPSTVHPRH